MRGYGLPTSACGDPTRKPGPGHLRTIAFFPESSRSQSLDGAGTLCAPRVVALVKGRDASREFV